MLWLRQVYLFIYLLLLLLLLLLFLDSVNGFRLVDARPSRLVSLDGLYGS